MTQYLVFAVLGLGGGAAFAAAAQALVLIQKASGVINFAQGAMALWGIYTFVELRTTGRLVLPIAVAIELEPLDVLPAFLIAIAMSGAIGLLVYQLVMRPLRAAPAIARVAAIVGVLLTLEGLAIVRFGWPAEDPHLVARILPGGTASVFGTQVPVDRLYLAGLVVACAAVLTALYRFTWFGLATRAASESERTAVIVGLRPAVYAQVNWILATMLATAFGILLYASTPLDVTFLVYSIVPALAAALVARFESFMIAALAGLAIGAVDGVVLKLQAEHAWLPDSGLQQGLPLLLIIVLVPLLGRKLSVRDPLGHVDLPIPRAPRHVARTAAIGLVAGGLAIALLPSAFRLGLTMTMIGAVICLSFVVITGYGGQISLAQVAIAGIAAFAVLRLTTSGGVPFPIAPIVAIAAAAAAGVLVGIPSLRWQGSTLAVVTLAAAVAIEQFLFRNDSLTRQFEAASIPAPEVFGVDLGVMTAVPSDYPSWRFSAFVLVLLIMTAVAVANLRRSPTGKMIISVRGNAPAAAAMGFAVTRVKLLAFAISAVIAGLGGVLLAYQQTTVSVASFTTGVSLGYLAYASIGGLTSIAGALVGGTLVVGGLGYVALDELFDFGRYAMLVSGLLLTVSAIANPRGVVAIPGELRRLRRPLRRDAAVPRPAEAAR